MAKGDGSIIEKLTPEGKSYSPKKWIVTVSHGRDPLTKERRRVREVVTGTKAKARKRRDEIRAELESGIKIDAGKATLSEFIKIWADAKRSSGKSSEASIQEDLGKLKHIERHIGDAAINDIDAVTVERVYALIRSERKLSGTSMNRIHTLLKNVFKKAMDYDLILRNPCDRVDAPKKNEPDRKALDKSECTRLAIALDELEQTELDAYAEKEERMAKLERSKKRAEIRGVFRLSCIQVIRIALATGMRRGEILGLEWDNVDLENRTISVVQSLAKSGDTKSPKTRAGIRTIHIDEATAMKLARWKKMQTHELNKLGIEVGTKTPVCCSDKGGYIDYSNFERFWRKFKQDKGFVGLRFHELRHTQATQLLANGVDVKTVQTRMGHANASITLNQYAHAVPENDLKAADLLEPIIGTGVPEREGAPDGTAL